MSGPRGTKPFAMIMPRVIIPFTANKPCHTPTVHMVSCHVFYGPTTCCVVCHVSIRTDCTVSTFFFPVCRFEHNAISLSSDICLNPNMLCWVRDDKAYPPVRFEAILSNFNFEQNLIPWIRQLNVK
jgi:hypothetical protein